MQLFSQILNCVHVTLFILSECLNMHTLSFLYGNYANEVVTTATTETLIMHFLVTRHFLSWTKMTEIVDVAYVNNVI
jgi:hypothetical protein